MRPDLFPTLVLLAMLPLFAGCGGSHKQAEKSEVPAAVKDSIPPLGFFTEDYLEKRGTVKSGETFSGLLTRLGVGTSAAYEMARMCSDSLFDVRRMRAGNRYRAYYRDSIATVPSFLVYENNLVDRTVFRFADSLDIRKVSRPVETVRKYADVTISSSLSLPC